MQFDLLTLSGSKFSGEVAEVSLATTAGQLGILPHHESLTAIAKPGEVVVRRRGKADPEVFVIFGGILDVANNQVRVLADVAEHIDDLVASEIEAALKHAQELKSGAKHKGELSHAQTVIDRHEVRLGVIRLHRRHRHN